MSMTGFESSATWRTLVTAWSQSDLANAGAAMATIIAAITAATANTKMKRFMRNLLFSRTSAQPRLVEFCRMVRELGGPHLGVLHHRRNPRNHVGDALAHGRHLLRFIELRRVDVVPLIALERTIYYCCFLTYFLCPSHRLLLTFLFHSLNPVFRRVLGKPCDYS